MSSSTYSKQFAIHSKIIISKIIEFDPHIEKHLTNTQAMPTHYVSQHRTFQKYFNMNTNYQDVDRYWEDATLESGWFGLRQDGQLGCAKFLDAASRSMHRRHRLATKPSVAPPRLGGAGKGGVCLSAFLS